VLPKYIEVSRFGEGTCYDPRHNLCLLFMLVSGLRAGGQSYLWERYKLPRAVLAALSQCNGSWEPGAAARRGSGCLPPRCASLLPAKRRRLEVRSCVLTWHGESDRDGNKIQVADNTFNVLGILFYIVGFRSIVIGAFKMLKIEDGICPSLVNFISAFALSEGWI